MDERHTRQVEDLSWAVRHFISSVEAARASINLALGIAMRAQSRFEFDNVTSTIGRELRHQLDAIEGMRETMKRRELMRGIAVLGLPVAVPWSVVHDALTSPWRTAVGAQALDTLAESVEALWQARQAAAYDQFTGMVPTTLSALLHRNDEHDDAHDLASLAYQAIAGAMAKVGHADLAWIAAERGVTSAKQSHNATVLAAAERMYGHALLAQDRSEQAEAVALDAAMTLPVHDEASLSVYGALMLTASVAAARQSKDVALDYIAEAQVAADRVGERNDYWTAFGITNVGIHRVSVSVELNEGGKAVEYAQTVSTQNLPLERRAHLLIDIAQAHDDDGQVIDALLTAEKIAPEEVRYNPTARALVRGLLRRSPSGTAIALAQRINVGAE